MQKTQNIFVRRAIFAAAATFLGTIFALPLVWFIFAPFNARAELGLAIPSPFTLSNFATVFQNTFAMQALLMRAKGLGYLSDNQNSYLWQQISARGWRTREPPELDFPHERPTVLNAIIKAHLADLGFTMSELSRLVPLHEPEFVKMYDLAEEATSKPRLRLVV